MTLFVPIRLFEAAIIANFALEDKTKHNYNMTTEQAEFANMSWEEQERYIAMMKQKWDYKNTIDFAEAKGEANRAVKTARKMLEKGFSPEDIAECTDLTEEQIKAL